MTASSFIFVHGYGVRGQFWDTLRNAALLDNAFGRVELKTPDMAISTPQEGVEQILRLAREVKEKTGKAPVLVGHSLGGILSAIAAKADKESLVAGLAVISSPWKPSGKTANNKFVRFLIRHGLLPGWLVMPRFFGKGIKRKAMRRIFSKAVPEERSLRDIVMGEPGFHAAELTGPFKIPAVFIASEADRIVEARQTADFAAAVSGELVLFPEDSGVGHDDLAVSETVARKILAILAARF